MANGWPFPPISWEGVDGPITVWDVSTGRELPAFAGRGWFAQLRFSANGKRLMCWSIIPMVHDAFGATIDSTCPRVLTIWDVPTRKKLHEVKVDAGHVVMAPDGETVAIEDPHCKTIVLTHVPTGSEVLKVDKVCARPLAFSVDGRWLAAYGSSASTPTKCILVLDTLTGRLVHTLPADSVESLVFSNDARLLASADADHTILVWDISAILSPPDSPAASAKELAQWWHDLAGDPVTVRKALAQLVARPAQTVMLLRERLRPAPGVDAQQIAADIKDLDDTRYAVRQKASQNLEQWGELSEPALREALRNNPTLERRRRLDILLDKLEAGPLPAQLPGLRAVNALEWIGIAEARELLTAVAKGAPGARLTQEAQGALDRLSCRAGANR
jgi:hypothetical protein